MELTSSLSASRLEDLPADGSLLGGKGLGLRRLQNLGATVPATVVVPTTTYARFVPDDASLSAAMRHIADADLRDVVAAIRDLIAGLPSRTFAVRSSANLEDLKDKSFAGQYETSLKCTVDDIERAVRSCWKSLWSEAVVEYRGQTTVVPRMAVLIQPYVSGIQSGVAFSANPATGNPFELVVEAADGDCDAVTDGTADSRIAVYDLLGYAAGRRSIPAPYDRLADLSLQFDVPIDVEWTVDQAGVLQILQARPVVIEAPYTRPAPQGWTLSFPETFTPLGASIERKKNEIYNRVLRRIVNPQYRRELLYAGARLYHRVDSDRLAFYGLGLAVPLVRSAVHCFRYARLLRRVKSDTGLADRSALGLTDVYLQIYESSIYVGYLSNLYTGFVVRCLSRLVGTSIERSLLYNALADVSSIATVRARRLGELAALFRPVEGSNWLAAQSTDFVLLFNRFVDEFDYVFVGTNPRDPGSCVDLALARRFLETYRVSETPVVVGSFSTSFWQAVGQGRFGRWRALISRLLLAPNRWIAPIKEDRNHVFYRLVSSIRASVRRDQHPQNTEDVDAGMFRTIDEIRREAAPAVHRRFLYDRSSKFVSPFAPPQARSTVSGSVIRGIPCSPGVGTGPVVIVRTREDFHKITTGCIVVTQTIRPFWTPILRVAAGLLTSSGGILSHGASIAREYRVPAVFGLGESVFELAPGQIVRVDGTTGDVTLMADEDSHSHESGDRPMSVPVERV